MPLPLVVPTVWPLGIMPVMADLVETGIILFHQEERADGYLALGVDREAVLRAHPYQADSHPAEWYCNWSFRPRGSRLRRCPPPLLRIPRSDEAVAPAFGENQYRPRRAVCSGFGWLPSWPSPSTMGKAKPLLRHMKMTGLQFLETGDRKTVSGLLRGQVIARVSASGSRWRRH
jgi:hypothetical protein